MEKLRVMRYVFFFKVVLTFSFSCLTIHSFSQKQGQARIDSLLIERNKQKVACPEPCRNDTNAVNTLNELSQASIDISSYVESIKYAEEALLLAQKITYLKGEANAYNNIGSYYNNQGNYPVALKNYFISLRIRKKIKDEQEIARSYNNIGLIYANQAKYQEALENYFAALKTFQKTGLKRGIAALYHNIGTVYQYQGNYPEALKNYFAALKINEETGNKNWKANNYGNIGMVYYLQGNYEEALTNYFIVLKIKEALEDRTGIAGAYAHIGSVYAKQSNYVQALDNLYSSLKIFQELGHKLGISTLFGDIGLVYLDQGNYSEALKSYNSALKIQEEIGDKAGIANSYNKLGTIQTQLKDYRQAKIYLQQGLKIALAISNKEAIKDSYGSLAKLDSATANWKSAFTNHKLFVRYSDSLNNEETKEKTIQEKMNYAFEKKEAATQAEQDKKDAIAREEIKRQRNIRNFSFTSLAALLLFSMLVVRQRNKMKKEKKRSENLLLNILPAQVAEELKATGSSEARLYNHVTVLFTDFVNFTGISERLSPTELVAEIHKNFTAFDAIIEKHGLEKIKTIGDAYLAVCGMPHENEEHAQKVVAAAIEICAFVAQNNSPFQIRIGINSGPVVAGIVGVKKYAYDIWGDTVNTAARMEQHSEAGKINISGATYALVQEQFACEHRGKIKAKNKGEIDMYFVGDKV